MKRTPDQLNTASTLLTALRVGVCLQFPGGTFIQRTSFGQMRIGVGCGAVTHRMFDFDDEGLKEALDFRSELGARFEKARRA